MKNIISLFKDFSKGKGLFGKYKDVFWWDSQVRGRVDQGVVLKDYAIDQPSQENNMTPGGNEPR